MRELLAAAAPEDAVLAMVSTASHRRATVASFGSL
jgi:hypothetical protein